MFVKVGILVKNHFPKSLFKHLYSIAGDILPLDILFGSEFRNSYTFLKQSESWDKETIEKYQFSQTKNVIEYAYENVPYYKNLFDSNGISTEDIQCLDDIRKIPYLTKELIKENYGDLISKKIHPGDSLIDYTGGSTSEPMKFLVDSRLIPRELAFFKYVWEKFGYNLGAKCIELKGAKVARPSEGIFWEHDKLLNYLKMDSDYLNDASSINYYIDKIRKFKSEYLFGFPSSIYLLAKQIEKNQVQNFPKTKLIMLASENTYDWQLDYIKETFKCDNIFYHYGHSEKATLAVKCLNDNIMHFLPQYGYTEIINSHGENAKSGELGEIVATGYNKCFPLIRYKTKDYASVSENQCGCIWNDYLAVSNIEGRLQEFIVTKDSRLVSICTMGAAHFKDLNNVLQTQYYQDTEGMLKFRIVPHNNEMISEKMMNTIKNTLEDKLEHSVDVKVEIVKSICDSPSGKHVMIVQNLDINKYI